MTAETLKRLAYEAFEHVKRVCPKDTLNLQNNAIKIVQVSDREWQITIGGAEAPYAVYTNEPWQSPRWNGKQNPNQGWINEAVKHIAEMIAGRSEGNLNGGK